jgi:ComF family protein
VERSVLAASGRFAGLGRLAASLIEAAFPVECARCGARLDREARLLLCDACAAGLADAGEPFCGTCASRGSAAEPRRCARGDHLRVRAGLVWNEASRALVHAFKFGDAPELAGDLADLATESPAFADRPRPELLCPVPLHAVRRRERGYDQAATLAHAFGERLGVVDVALLERVRPTRQQARLGRIERARNVAGAFCVVRPAAVRGRSVAIVDDVVTTGATATACAEALAAAGARRVEVWCAAYEPHEEAGETA